MSILYSPWTSQPQQAVGIDWGNPITRGLVSACTSDFDFVLNRVLLKSGTRKFARANGLLSGFGTTYGVASTDSITTPLNKHGQQRTYIAQVFIASANDSGANGRILEKRTAAQSSQVELIYPPQGVGGNYFSYYRTFSTTAGEWRTPSNSVAPNTLQTIAVSYDSSSTSNVPAMYLDGAPVTATAITSPVGTLVDNAAEYILGNRTNDSARGLNGGIGYVYIFDRILSASEIRSISQNPWQIFKPLPRRIFAPVAAATGDATGTGSLYDVTLSAPTGTATGTGASNGTGTGALSAVSTAAPSATATGSALATGALTTVTLTTITASATGSALATGSLDAIDLSTVSGTATGTTAGNATGVGAVATIALSAPSASAVGSALATGGFSHVSLSAVSGTASAATNGQATADLQPISISAPLAVAIASSVATGGIQSIGLTAPNASATGQAQTIARPSADTINSGWAPSTGSDLYAMLDEVTPNDADYISTASAGSVCRLGLGAVADPGTSSGQVVSYRASSSTGNGLKVELMQGGTVIATWNHASLPATDTTYQQSLSAAECDAITDYTALSVRLTSL